MNTLDLPTLYEAYKDKYVKVTTRKDNISGIWKSMAVNSVTAERAVILEIEGHNWRIPASAISGISLEGNNKTKKQSK